MHMAKFEILGASQSMLHGTLVHHGPPASGWVFSARANIGDGGSRESGDKPLFSLHFTVRRGCGPMGAQELSSLYILFMAVPRERESVCVCVCRVSRDLSSSDVILRRSL
jgi:hypothetical protein